jgi:prefoldin beta subunit
MAEMSEEKKQFLGQAQVYQQQLQGIMTQKEALKMQATELKKAVDEIDKTKETEVYKISGPILIKSKKAEVKKDLQGKETLLKAQVDTLEKTEKRIKEKLEELHGKLVK